MRFNAMIERLQGSRAALDESMAAQRQLVADASHELRTPVTSLRTNIEVLLAGGELDPRVARPAAVRRRRADRGAERAGRRPDRAGPRRPAAERDRGGAPGQDRRRGGRPRAAQRARDRLRGRAEPTLRRRHARAPGPRRQQPARQRRPPLARRGRGRGDRRHRRVCGCATTAAGSTRPTCPTSSTASTEGSTRAGVRAAAWVWRSCARRPSSTAAGSALQRARRRSAAHLRGPARPAPTAAGRHTSRSRRRDRPHPCLARDGEAVAQDLERRRRTPARRRSAAAAGCGVRRACPSTVSTATATRPASNVLCER